MCIDIVSEREREIDKQMGERSKQQERESERERGRERARERTRVKLIGAPPLHIYVLTDTRTKAQEHKNTQM